MLSSKREGRLTASSFASAMGIGYSSRQKLWREITGRDAKFAGNEATEYGNQHEQDAVNAYEISQNCIVELSGDNQHFFIHDEYDWLGCTPDGFSGDKVVEFKCPYHKMYDDAPAHYIAQVQGQMAITGYRQADLVAWSPDELKIWRIDFSQDYWDSMLPLLEDFWKCVQDDVEPKRRKKPVMPEIKCIELI